MRSQVLNAPFSGSNCLIDRKTSRNTCCTASSASAPLRRMRLAIPKRVGYAVRTGPSKHPRFRFANALPVLRPTAAFAATGPARPLWPGEGYRRLPATQASPNSTARAGSKPKTSRAMRELIVFLLHRLSREQQSSRDPGSVGIDSYTCMHASCPVFPVTGKKCLR